MRTLVLAMVAIGLSLPAAAAVPAVGADPAQAPAPRGCPPPPTGAVAALDHNALVLNALTSEITFSAPHDGWEMGRISWAAADSNGLIYVLHRGDKAEPIVVVDRSGKVVRSWGKGLFSVPHSLRIDPRGHVWTTDADTSIVRKFSPAGELLLTIDVGEVPANCDWPTRGATDVAFAPNGHIYVADGYTNARVVEYSPDGKKIRQWGSRGAGRGEFVLPHSIAIDEAGIVHVADRENGRVQRFTLDGKWLGESLVGGKPFTVAVARGELWIDVRVVDAANVVRPTAMRANKDGVLTGLIPAPGGHGLAVSGDGPQLLIPSGTRLFLVSVPR